MISLKHIISCHQNRFHHLLCFLIFSINSFAQTSSVSQGIGNTLQANMMPNCPSNHTTPLGTITSSDGVVWQVPAPIHFSTSNFLSDLHNSCNNVVPNALSNIDLSNIPVHVLDNDGDTITGYLFCDNYFELYINGQFIGVDAVPFTPFNSSVVRFKVSKPYTISVLLVDWEENLGLGTEVQATTNYHPGDGGFIAQFSDGTVTDSTWKAQVFYLAPLDDPNIVSELPNHVRSTATASNNPSCTNNCYAVHFPIDSNWTKTDYDDSFWPNAYLYTAAQVTNQPAYTNFANTCWSNSKFIWTSNLILDNLVLTRKKVNAVSGLNKISENTHWLSPKLIGNEIQLCSTADRQNVKFSLYNMLGKSIYEWSMPKLTANEIVHFSYPKNNQNHEVLLLKVEDSEGMHTFKIVL